MSKVAQLKKQAAEFEQKKQFDKALALYVKLLDAFGVKATTLRPDTGRNTLIITGSGSDRQAAIDTIVSFDADWMRGQSVGIFPVRNSTPEPLISEMEKIMDSGEGGLSQSVVKFQPIPAAIHASTVWL